MTLEKEEEFEFGNAAPKKLQPRTVLPCCWVTWSVCSGGPGLLSELLVLCLVPPLAACAGSAAGLASGTGRTSPEREAHCQKARFFMQHNLRLRQCWGSVTFWCRSGFRRSKSMWILRIQIPNTALWSRSVPDRILIRLLTPDWESRSVSNFQEGQKITHKKEPS